MTPSSESGLGHYVRVLRHNLWLVLLVFVLTTAAATYYSERQAKRFESSAAVFLGTQNQAAALSNVPAQSSDPVRQAATQADLAQTPLVAERALKLARVTGRTPEELLANSSVSSPSNADILTFSVTDSQPRVAERLAESYATAYTRYRRQLDTTAIASALRQTQQQLANAPTSPAKNQYKTQCGPSAPYQRCVIEVDPDAPKIKEPATGATSLTLTLTIKPDKVAPVAPVTISCTTAPGTGKDAATAPSDYNTETVSATFAPNTTSQTMTFPGLVNADATDGKDETFFLNCTSPDNSADVDKDDQQVTITIQQPAPPPKPKPTPPV